MQLCNFHLSFVIQMTIGSVVFIQASVLIGCISGFILEQQKYTESSDTKLSIKSKTVFLVDNTVFYITNNRKIPLIFVSIKQNTAIDNNKAEKKNVKRLVKF